MLTLGIDAANLRQGGGRTHLIQLLRAADPPAHGFSKVIVWGSKATLDSLDERDWLCKINPIELEGGLISRSVWQRFALSRLARAEGCDVLFVPGGSFSGDFRPFVAMSRNMLPFECRELARYGVSWSTLKLWILRQVQMKTFRLANGVIFLSDYAKKIVQSQVDIFPPNLAVIPHGMCDQFRCPPRLQKPICAYSSERPFKVLYVSIVDQYKHQWHVVEAIRLVRQRTGWSLHLEMVGPHYPRSLSRLIAAMRRCDPSGEWAHYLGAVSHQRLELIYRGADMGLFASSCENMPNILLETMAAGLPVASSNRGPMIEILNDAGVYFDPESPSAIADTLEKLISDEVLRQRLADKSFSLSSKYSWQRCSTDTLAFLASVHTYHAMNSDVCAG